MKWPVVKLSEIISLQYGRALRKDDRDPSGFIPVAGSNGIDGYHNKPLVRGPGIVVGRKGSAGKVTWFDCDFWPIDTTYFVQPKIKCELRWIYYLLNHLQLDRLAITTGVPGLNREDAYRTTLPLPPLSEQRRIVEILDQADALRKKRAEADAKAARILPALFYKMFGDPLALVTSGDGIPLGDLNVDLQNGFACGEKDVEGGIPHLRMNNIDDAGVLNFELIRTVPLDRDVERYRLVKEDVLFMGTNSEDKIGKTCLFLPPDDRTYLFSNHLTRLRVSDSRITPEYLAGLLHLLWSKRFFPSIAKRWVNQSTVSQSALTALRVPLPAERSLQVFTTAFQNLLSLRAQRVRSGQILDQSFAILLNRAFTGDLTAKWREAHMKELLQEMEQQAKELKIDDC